MSDESTTTPAQDDQSTRSATTEETPGEYQSPERGSEGSMKTDTPTDEKTVAQHVNQIEGLEELVEDLVEKRVEEETRELRERIEDLEQQLEREVEPRMDALARRTEHRRDQVRELQERELEKGAHLQEDHVDEREIDVEAGKLEKMVKDDGRKYVRVPGAEDEVTGVNVALAHDDLLPIQQLARLDDEMLDEHTASKPQRLAVLAWRERKKDRSGIWQSGSKNVRHYVDASDLRAFIRSTLDESVKKEYAKKLASRTIDQLLHLTKNRVAVRKRDRKADGLKYDERRVILPEDVEIPGDAPAAADGPGTSVVAGD